MKKKYLFLSGLLSALLLVGVSPVQAAPEVYQTKQEAEAAPKAHAKEIHENTLRYGVSVTEGSKLVEDNRLYKDGKMPPLTEKMDVLNALFSSMLKKENLDLKVRTLRVAKDEGKVTIGNPTLFFRAVDLSDYKIVELGKNRRVAIPVEFIVLHRKDAEKALSLVPLGYLEEDRNGKKTYALLDFEHYSTKELGALKETKDLVKARRTKIAKESRDEAIAGLLFAMKQESAAAPSKAAALQ